MSPVGIGCAPDIYLPDFFRKYAHPIPTHQIVLENVPTRYLPIGILKIVRTRYIPVSLKIHGCRSLVPTPDPTSKLFSDKIIMYEESPQRSNNWTILDELLIVELVGASGLPNAGVCLSRRGIPTRWDFPRRANYSKFANKYNQNIANMWRWLIPISTGTIQLFFYLFFVFFS